jgi:hypothetical protein
VPAVTYTAKRSLIAGHTAGSQYSLDLRLVEGGLGVGRKVGSETQRSLSDKTETLYFYGKTTWSAIALVLNSTERAALAEFLHSVEAGESFTFSPYGSAAAMGTTFTARRVTATYNFERLDGTGATPNDDAMRVSFDLEEA